jgi:cytochrome c biogenesis protein ResB
MRRGKEPLPFMLFFDYRERVKSYVSEITILDGAGREVKKAALKVNQPLTHRGYTIYQSSYDRESHGWTGLQVVADPGLWVVYAGFALLLAGVVFIFYFKPYLRRRKKGGATADVAGESLRAIP